MLLSVSLILLVGMGLGWICKKIKLPALVGMLATGITLGPYVLNLIDPAILNISAELRKIALIIILTRAGLTLNVADLKKVGRPAILMCFVPAAIEMIGMTLLAPIILGISTLDAAIMGAVIAAVSPAVIVPKMIKLIEDGYGTKKAIPQMILAGASVDDVFVIVMFSAFTTMATGNHVDILSFINIPVSIILGILIGLGCGVLLSVLYAKVSMRDTAKTLIFLCVSILLVVLEDKISFGITFSALIAIMFIGVAMQKKAPERAKHLSSKFNKLWVGAEVLLFVLVGATVDLSFAFKIGPKALILIVCVLLFRMAGVQLCMLGTKLNLKERSFCMLAYMPKATVQAAIGGVPLAMGLSCGNDVLCVAVLAILITAPVGAFAIDLTYRKALEKEPVS